jgi:hypothetical protein
MKGLKYRRKSFIRNRKQFMAIGEDGEDSVFPNFDLNSHELEYGLQRDDSEIIIEIKAKIKTGERILVRLNVELFPE